MWIVHGSEQACVAMAWRDVTVSTDVTRAIELLDKLQKSGDVPVEKLQALQRVLQSEFCTAIREVLHRSPACMQTQARRLRGESAYL